MAYPAETWAKVKADYETGNYSVPDLSEKYTISEPAIKLKISDEKWVKGALKEKIEEKHQNKIINELSKIGWDEKRLIENFAGILEAENTNKHGIVEPNWQARAKAHDMIFKLKGSYAPVENKISGDPNNPLQIQSITRKIIK